MHSKVSKFIIGHVRPQITFPPQFSFVTDVLNQPTDFKVDVLSLKDEGLSDRRIGEYMYLFALRRELENTLRTAEEQAREEAK